VVNTATGLNDLDPKMIHLARSMGASTWETFIRFRLPNSLPVFFAGLKVGVTLAVIGALVGEFVGAGSGLGHLTVIAMGSLNTELVFASIIVMAAIGVAMYVAVEILERVFVPWSRADRLRQMTA
jgi:NitT/TauT family transport system permease protein